MLAFTVLIKAILLSIALHQASAEKDGLNAAGPSLLRPSSSIYILPSSDETDISIAEVISLSSGSVYIAGTVSDGGFTVYPAKDKSIHGPDVKAASAGFLVKAVPTPSGGLETSWVKTLSPTPLNSTTNAFLQFSDVKHIPSSKAVIVTGSFTGDSDDIILKGGPGGVHVFVAKVLETGVFEWAVGFETIKGSAVEAVPVAEASPAVKDSNELEPPMETEVEAVSDRYEESEYDRRSEKSAPAAFDIKLPTKVAIDRDGNILMAGTFNGELSAGLNSTIKSEPNLYDGFLVKLSADSGEILAHHSGFTGLKTSDSKLAHAVFVHNSSFIITGESYTTENITSLGLRGKSATSLTVRIVENGEKPIKFESGTQTVAVHDLETLDHHTYLYSMNDSFVIGPKTELQTVLSHYSIRTPSIAAISSEIVYISGFVNDTKHVGKVVDGTSFAEKGPFNYLIGFNVLSKSPVSKTAIPHPSELSTFEGLPRQIASGITIRSSPITDTLLAFGGMDSINKDGSVGKSNGGAWVGVLDLTKTVAYSEGFASFNDQEDSDIAPSKETNVTCSANVSASHTVTSAFPASIAQSDSAFIISYSQSTRTPAPVNPVDEEVEPAEQYPEEEDFPNNGPVPVDNKNLELEDAAPPASVISAEDGNFLSTESYVTRVAGSSNVEFRGSFMNYINAIFNPSPRGDYQATLKSEDDESLIGMSHRGGRAGFQPQAESSATPKPGRSILAPVQRKPSLESTIAPRNDATAIPSEGSRGKAPEEVAVPLTTESWDWDDDEFGGEDREKEIGKSKNGKQEDEWGW
ncbi:hypothetical protein BDR26DRAFT_868207 [Obelidium mucronatum]|nr:hypothetical protein BDR26DRAFT_868207 [Obelidium mucronatum]